MSCKKAEQLVYFRAEAGITCENHKISPAGTAQYNVKIQNDGPSARLVTVEAKCQGPLLQFSHGIDHRAQEEVPPLMGSRWWQIAGVDVICGQPTDVASLPHDEFVKVFITTASKRGAFPGRLNPIHLILSVSK